MATEATTDVEEHESDELEPLLEIEAFAPKRPTILVHTDPESESDKALIVELKLMREFGIATQQALKSDSEEFQEIWNKRGLTNKEGKHLKVLLDRMYTQVVVTSETFTPAIRDQIDDEQRSTIVMAFTYAPLAIAAARERRLEKEASDDDESTTAT